MLEQEGSLACAQEWSAPSKGTELLTPALADAFQRLGIMPSDISRIACVAGPGSFTGLRLALSDSTLAFRRATGAAVAPLNALQALRGLRALRPSLSRPRNAHPRDPHTARRGRLVHGQDFLVPPPVPPCHPPWTSLPLWEIPAALRRRAPRHHAGQRGSPQSAPAGGDSSAIPRPSFCPPYPIPQRRHCLMSDSRPAPDGYMGAQGSSIRSISAPATPWTISPPIAASVVRLPKRPYAQLDKLLGPSAEEVVRGSR